MVSSAPVGRHGYTSLVGRQILGSRQVYLDHLGQWWTALYGGVGHNFFADAEHHPVQFRAGVRLPGDLWDESAQTLGEFQQLLVFGDAPLPDSLKGWTELDRAGAWRKLARPSGL